MKCLLPGVVLFCLGGCGTTMNMGPGPCPVYEHPRVLGGVQFDGEHLIGTGDPLRMLCGVVDLPFSLAADVVTLPYTISETVRYASRHSAPDPFEKDRDKKSAPRRREE